MELKVVQKAVQKIQCGQIQTQGTTDTRTSSSNTSSSRIRAHVAAKARQLKRDQRISDTWTRDGFIFVKKNNSSYKIATMRELAVFAVD